MKPGAFCFAPVGPLPAARWHGQRSILVLELSQWLLNSVAEANDVLRIELQAGSAVDDPQIAYLLLALRADLASSSPSGRACADAISRAVAYRLLMAHGVSPSPRPSRGGLSQRSLRRVLEFIDAHLDRDLPLKSMADISGLSVDHFARAFRESTGEPPHRYLLLRRLLRAKLLLEHSEVPIVEIAQMVGFADQSHLTNNLRRYLGTTPRKLRAEWTGPEDSAGILQ
jgi:AraC family transcriptional regulator